jgi:hypothetical protein
VKAGALFHEANIGNSKNNNGHGENDARTSGVIRSAT